MEPSKLIKNLYFYASCFTFMLFLLVWGSTDPKLLSQWRESVFRDVMGQWLQITQHVTISIHQDKPMAKHCRERTEQHEKTGEGLFPGCDVTAQYPPQSLQYRSLQDRSILGFPQSFLVLGHESSLGIFLQWCRNYVLISQRRWSCHQTGSRTEWSVCPHPGDSGNPVADENVVRTNVESVQNKPTLWIELDMSWSYLPHKQIHKYFYFLFYLYIILN